jgi:hypothetical protein
MKRSLALTTILGITLAACVKEDSAIWMEQAKWSRLVESSLSRSSTPHDAERAFLSQGVQATWVSPDECVSGSRTEQVCAGGPVVEAVIPVDDLDCWRCSKSLVARVYFDREEKYAWFQIVPWHAR